MSRDADEGESPEVTNVLSGLECLQPPCDGGRGGERWAACRENGKLGILRRRIELRHRVRLPLVYTYVYYAARATRQALTGPIAHLTHAGHARAIILYANC